MSQQTQQYKGSWLHEKSWIAYTVNAFLYLLILSGCNMPTKPESLPTPEIRTDRYKEYSCTSLNSEITDLVNYEISLTKSQSKRINDSQGHAIFYGWGKGDGMDTIELVKARGKISAMRKELSNKGCN